MSRRMDSLRDELQKSYGQDAAAFGGLSKKMNVVPTGSLALDYELGTGGWPLGYLFGVFGPRDIGKSSVIGFSAIANAQAMGLNCALIAMEPNFDEVWANLHGVITDEEDERCLLVSYPETGEQAFEMLHKIIRSGAVDFIVFDSIGALVSKSEMEEDGTKKVGGQSGLITWGIKVAAPLAFRNNVGVMLLNQVRDKLDHRGPGKLLQQPGGHALEHHESIIVQLRWGKDRYTVKQDGTDVEIGRQVIAHIVRNKMSQGGGKKALFDFYSMEVEGYPFGIDWKLDTLLTGKRLGVIGTRGAWLDLPSGKSLNGLKKAQEHLVENPEEALLIREAVIEAMLNREADAIETGDEKKLKLLG